MDLIGERALLLYPPGLDYLTAFFGCLYAGVIAVPAYPPRNQRNTPRIQAIAIDAEAKIALTTETLLPRMQSLLGTIGNLQWLSTDTLEARIEASWQKPSLDQDAIAFLQYTSGSTGTPKGVMVSHGNLLHNGGVGLARGYLNQPELTKEKFIENPFNKATQLYKTGDLARYLPALTLKGISAGVSFRTPSDKDTASRPKELAPNVLKDTAPHIASREASAKTYRSAYPLGHNGSIEYLGRIDHQVKIRGFRIELGEIEAVLSQHPAVRETVVVVREISQRQQLIAYIVLDRDRQWSTEEGKNYLKGLLPEYMLPSALVMLDQLPLLPNGKINRRALPLPESASTTVAHQAPSSEIERKIAAIWREALHLEKVGIDDNFFDLGGHSLLLLEVNQKLRKSLQRDLSVVEMFQNPTIASLAEYLTQSCDEKDAFQAIRDRTSQRIKATNRQKRLAKNK